MVEARQLAAWAGPRGPRVTPTGALRPAEVPDAAAVLGHRMQPPVRRAADVPQVHRGWLMAVATGMIQLASGRATSTGTSTDDDDTVLAGWLDGLRSICTDLSDRRYPETLQWLVLLVLEALLDNGLAEEPPPDLANFKIFYQVQYALTHEPTLREVIFERRSVDWIAPQTPRGSDWRLFDLLADAGAVRGTDSAPEATALGRWLAGQLRALAPVQIKPDWPASAVLAQMASVGEDADLRRLTIDWRLARAPMDVARQLLCAASDADAAGRTAAVRLITQYGNPALPAWRKALHYQNVAPHAREVLSWWDRGPGPQDEDRWWLGVEWAAAALSGAGGPDEALSCLADAAGPTPQGRPDPAELVASLPRSGHPQADEVAQALTAFLASGEPRSIDHQLQVRIRLAHWRPATWRRVLIPATDNLGTLHWVIQVLFGWGSGHLHIFRTSRSAYTDFNFPLDGTQDEDDARLSRLFSTGVHKFTYTYDLGTEWEHEITLEKPVPITPGQAAIRCVSYAGDCPLEYPELEDDHGNPIDDPAVTKPFRLNKVNATLAAGHYLDDWYLDDDTNDEAEQPD